MSKKNKIQEIDWEKERKQVIADLHDECQSIRGKLNGQTRKNRDFEITMENEIKWRRELLNKYTS